MKIFCRIIKIFIFFRVRQKSSHWRGPARVGGGERAARFLLKFPGKYGLIASIQNPCWICWNGGRPDGTRMRAALCAKAAGQLFSAHEPAVRRGGRGRAHPLAGDAAAAAARHQRARGVRAAGPALQAGGHLPLSGRAGLPPALLSGRGGRGAGDRGRWAVSAAAGDRCAAADKRRQISPARADPPLAGKILPRGAPSGE